MKQSKRGKTEVRGRREREGLAKPHPVGENVLASGDGYWEWFRRRDPPNYTITGKYLFFSEDRDDLVKIAIDELDTNGFHHAKINMKGKNIGPEYVLCLYFRDDSRKYELADRYRGRAGIRYRYWKSDMDTLRGKYSEEFLSKLSPKERSDFTKAEKSSGRRGA